MIRDKFALALAVLTGLASIISGARDDQRKKVCPVGSLLLAAVAAVGVYAAF